MQSMYSPINIINVRRFMQDYKKLFQTLLKMCYSTAYVLFLLFIVLNAVFLTWHFSFMYLDWLLAILK